MNTKTDRRPSDSPPANGSAPRLRVMTKDIRGAKRNDWDNCPIARAAKRVWPDADVQVFNQHVLVNGYQVSHTDDTREFSTAWDESLVRPRTLEIPEEMIERLSVQSAGSAAEVKSGRRWCRATVFRHGAECQCEGRPMRHGFCPAHAWLHDAEPPNDKLSHAAGSERGTGNKTL